MFETIINNTVLGFNGAITTTDGSDLVASNVKFVSSVDGIMRWVQADGKLQSELDSTHEFHPYIYETPGGTPVITIAEHLNKSVVIAEDGAITLLDTNTLTRVNEPIALRNEMHLVTTDQADRIEAIVNE
jgi:hypothetical protein